jgi:hypothetical protein
MRTASNSLFEQGSDKLTKECIIIKMNIIFAFTGTLQKKHNHIKVKQEKQIENLHFM